MIKLLKGDDSQHTVELSLPQAAFASGMMIEFALGSYKATFAAEKRVTLDFPAAWTSRQSPGRLLGRWTLISPEGDRATILSAYPVYITIDAADVSTGGEVSAPIVPTVDLSDLEELNTQSSPGETKNLLNELLRRLRSACITVAMLFTALFTSAAEVSFSPLDTIPGTATVVTNVSFEGFATTGEVAEVDAKIAETHGYAKGVYNYMQGNTNAWFAGTNYPERANAHTKHRFQFEPGMDLVSVPCSMALWEIREGEKPCVWDQRDWTSWYWSFKAQQFQERINATNAAIIASIPRKAWGSYTASGLDNPDPTTTWVDTATTTLAAGFAWQSIATVSGCAYWTIVGDGAVIGGSGTNAVLEICDFEGKTVMRIVKGESRLAYLEKGEIINQGRDAQGRITFDMIANVQPVGEYSTTLVGSDFVPESADNCPADFEWEDLGNGKWRIHYLLKSGIDSYACFAQFKVAIERESTIEYATAPTISGGLVYKGVKIAPVIPDNANIGDIVPWKVVAK